MFFSKIIESGMGLQTTSVCTQRYIVQCILACLGCNNRIALSTVCVYTVPMIIWDTCAPPDIVLGLSLVSGKPGLFIVYSVC